MSCEALAGALGAVAGGTMTLLGMWFQQYLDERKQNGLDEARKGHLKRMLSNASADGWMKIETLARVIGADLDETRRLLIQIGARGSLREKEVWSLISRNPLPKADEQN